MNKLKQRNEDFTQKDKKKIWPIMNNVIFYTNCYIFIFFFTL